MKTGAITGSTTSALLHPVGDQIASDAGDSQRTIREADPARRAHAIGAGLDQVVAESIAERRREQTKE
jgi:hypothetical protein